MAQLLASAAQDTSLTLVQHQSPAPRRKRPHSGARHWTAPAALAADVSPGARMGGGELAPDCFECSTGEARERVGVSRAGEFMSKQHASGKWARRALRRPSLNETFGDGANEEPDD